MPVSIFMDQYIKPKLIFVFNRQLSYIEVYIYDLFVALSNNCYKIESINVVHVT